MHPSGTQFFLLGRVRGVGFFEFFGQSHQVPIMFLRLPMCSSTCMPSSQCVRQHVCQVPNVFVNMSVKFPMCETLGSILNNMFSTLWPMYIGERKRTFAKAYGIKVRYYVEHEKRSSAQFWPGLITLAKNTLPIESTIGNLMIKLEVHQQQSKISCPLSGC